MHAILRDVDWTPLIWLDLQEKHEQGMLSTRAAQHRQSSVKSISALAKVFLLRYFSGIVFDFLLQVRGTVSARTWLLVAYLAVLHFAVMFSFTRRNDLDALCAGIGAGVERSLPGT